MLHVSLCIVHAMAKVRLNDDEVVRIREMVNTSGLEDVSNRIGISRLALATAAAGFNSYPATLFVIRLALEKLAS